MAWARAVEDAETQSRRKEANLDHWFLRFLCAAVLHSLEFTEEGCGLWILTFLVSSFEKGAGRGVLSPVAIEHARKDWRPKSIHNQNQTKKTLHILQTFAIKIFWRREENLLQRQKKKNFEKDNRATNWYNSSPKRQSSPENQ